MTDLARTHAVHPVTGEVIELDQPSGDLAGWLEEIRDAESKLRVFKRDLQDAILARMDRDASWTLREGDFEISGDGPGRVSYDGDELAEVLAGLVEEGLISAQAAEAACETVTTYKPKARGINALRKLGGSVAEVIDSLAEPVPEERRRVSVKRRTW